MELKELIDLQHFQLRDEPTGDNEKKKVRLHSVFVSLLTLVCGLFFTCFNYFVPLGVHLGFSVCV